MEKVKKNTDSQFCLNFFIAVRRFFGLFMQLLPFSYVCVCPINISIKYNRSVLSLEKLSLRKMVPITRRASSFIVFFVCTLIERRRRRGETEQQQQTYHSTQGYNILHRLQVYHLTLTFIIHRNIYQNDISSYCSNHNAFY